MDPEENKEGEAQEPESFEAFESRANSEEEETLPEEKEETPASEEPENQEGDDSEEEEGDEDDSEESGEEEESKPKPKKKASERIRELNRQLRETERARESDRKGFEARLAALENNSLTEEDEDGNEGAEEKAPDPSDREKYPLGALDDRYIEDSINHRVQQALKADRESSLQRQEQSDREAAEAAIVADLRSKADNVAEKGADLHDDYQKVVVDAGLAGEYDLTQTTFEAAADAEHGAQILYDLATDKKEASRVARLSSFEQLKYVMEKNSELASGTGKKIPGAPPPPKDTPRGNSNRKTISPATTNFAEFEKLANSKT